MLLRMIRGRGCDAHHYIHALSKNLNAFNITYIIITYIILLIIIIIIIITYNISCFIYR